MKCLIVTGGTIEGAFARGYIGDHMWDYIISADAGMRFCMEAGLEPNLIVGDFDSVDEVAYEHYHSRYPERFRTFPAEKDESDTELALMYAIEEGAKEVTILGATGTRFDHVMANVHLLLMAVEAGVDCKLVDAHNRIRLLKDETILRKNIQFGKYVSLFPFTPEVTGLTLRGFSYEVDDFTLKSGKSRGVSNQIAQDEAVISWKDGLLLMIESRD